MVGSHVPGQLLIWYAFAANLIAGFAFYKVARGNNSYRDLALKSYHLFGFTTLLAVIYLFYLFFTHDFSIKYVYEYSDRSLPFFFLLSSFWGGQEGTYLLWLFLSVIFGYVLIRNGGKYTAIAMTVYSLVNLFFLTMLVKLSPFALLPFHAHDGAGLNPLLQDPWMVVHPPVMFVGYAAAGVPFAIAMAALIKNDYREWLKRAFPWVTVTSLMLAAGNILGGYWAYKTLGWGGYWGWDPVENSSLVPWLVSLALVHSLILERLKGAMRKTNLLLAAFVFLLVVYGTFLTRSGVLGDFSVHSFVDLGSNAYLVGFLIAFTVMTLGLFLVRSRAIESSPLNYNVYGREFFLFIGMLLLFLFSMIVLFWSSLPLLTSLVGMTPRAADVATYNSFALPFAILFALLLTVSPFSGGGVETPRKWRLKLAISVVASLLIAGLLHFWAGTDIVFSLLFVVVVTTLAMYLMKEGMFSRLFPALVAMLVTVIFSLLVGVRTPSYLLFFAVAAMCVTSNIIFLFRFLPRQWKLAGAPIAHFGFGVMIIGILGSSAFSTNTQVVLPKGGKGTAFGREIVYLGMEHDITFPKNKLIIGLKDHGSVEKGYPQLYYSERLQGFMKKPYIKKELLYDLYFSPQQVRRPESAEGLKLLKEKKKKLGDYVLTFTGFAIGDHANMQGSMRVSANIVVEHNGQTDTLAPAVMAVPTEDGGSSFMDFPASFGPNDEYVISIERILVEERAVVVSIPGLYTPEEAETLILDVTKEPIINLVWVGTTLILLGALVTYFRRKRELLKG